MDALDGVGETRTGMPHPRKDTDRDKILTAEDAKDYGIIDTVLEYRKLSAQNS